MAKNAWRYTGIFLERELLESEALRSLTTRTAYRILLIFYSKRKMGKAGRKGYERWDVVNNGEIVFTYQEAKTKYGISYGAFRNAIDELMDRGFIDIAESGAGLHKSANLYSISNRWKSYGTPEYKEPKPRPQKPINKGFQKGNMYGRNCRNEKNSTVAGQHSSTVVV